MWTSALWASALWVVNLSISGADRCSEAISVLDGNWNVHTETTVPALGLYPHQWSWDTAFIAVGHASINVSRAKLELRHLFDAQWSNGMVPLSVFNPAVPTSSYFPGADWWRSSEAARGVAPAKVQTSGITNPPVHTGAVLRIADSGSPEFLEEMWPKLDAMLSYFHRERNPTGRGLVYVRHPWENGMDNSPLWDKPLYTGIPNSSLLDLPPYNRTDIHKGVDPRDRPSQAFYDRAVYILIEARQRGYDESKMWREGLPFAVYDSFFNSLVLRGYEEMSEIAKRVGKIEDMARYVSWAEELAIAIEEELWDDEKGMYGVKNALTGERIVVKHLTCLAPLFYITTNAKKMPRRREHIARLVQLVSSGAFCGDGSCNSLPTLARDEPAFDSRNYWRGPIWVNTNWLLFNGLTNHNASREAERLHDSIQRLVEREGFYEYFDPLSGAAHGTGAFSWTAALYYDSVCRDRDGHADFISLI